MGHKSPAKVLRSTKRITNFLRNKWKTDKHISIQPTQTLAICQNTTVPHSCPSPTYSQDQILPLDLETFKLILKQNDTERQIEREKLNIERKKEREKDIEQFKLELEKVMLDLALPP